MYYHFTLGNFISLQTVDTLERCQIKLFDNDNFSAAILLDRRMNVLLEKFLRARVKKYILSLSTLHEKDNNIISTSTYNINQFESNDELEAELENASHRRNIESNNTNEYTKILEEFSSFLKRPRDHKSLHVLSI